MLTGQDIADFLGRGDDTELVTLAGLHLPVVTAFVKSYTRGNGWELGTASPEIEAVIKTSTARLAINPQQARRIQIDDFSQTFSTLDGWTLPELAVLNLFRRRVG